VGRLGSHSEDSQNLSRTSRAGISLLEAWKKEHRNVAVKRQEAWEDGERTNPKAKGKKGLKVETFKRRAILPWERGN